MSLLAHDPTESQLILIAQLLRGAALADGQLDPAEQATIRETLELWYHHPLPNAVIALFNEAITDSQVEAWCEALKLEGPEERRVLLSLVARVTDADELHDLDEDAYLRRVARGIGASDEEYADMVTELAEVTGPPLPPPLPSSD